MNLQQTSEKIQQFLRDSETRKRLSDRFATAREHLTTSIGEATKLASISPEKARYAETVGILSPGRSRESKETKESKGGPHRRYGLAELNRLILVGDLVTEGGFSMSEIVRFLNHSQSTTDDIINTIQASDIATRVREAEASYLQRMVIPRLMYFIQCLLLGDILDCTVAIVLPVRSDAAPSHSDESLVSIETVDELPLVGSSLIGWHSRSHPYCVLHMSEPRMDDTTRYEIRSIDDICRDAEVPGVDEHPTGAYLLIEREFATRLYPSPSTRARSESEPGRNDTTWGHPNPYTVAHRLLRYLQQPSDGERSVFGHQYSTVGDGMVYSSPELINDVTGDRLLTEIARLVVELGNAASTDTSVGRGRWIFSAILLPDNRSLPPGRQTLVVKAQSDKSPHILGVTRVTPGKNEGLSTIAALSGHMLIRRAVESTDAAVADAGTEENPGPALALPVMNSNGRLLAVLYIRASYENDATILRTFTADDQLLLRVIGHVVGGIVYNYLGSYLARDVLAGMIEQPRNIDTSLQEFFSANAFWDDLQRALKGRFDAMRSRESEPHASESEKVSPITLIAIDIDGHSTVYNTHGYNTARNLVRAVGKRIAGQPLLTSSQLMAASNRSNRLYHYYGDCFFLILENRSREDAENYARNLSELLNGSYSLEITRATGNQAIPVATVTLKDVTVRIALISYDCEALRGLLRSAAEGDDANPEHDDETIHSAITIITNALDAGLSQGKQTGPGTIMYLDTSRGLFRKLSVKEDAPPTQSGHAATDAANSNA